jgi:hypothetical protein
LHFRHYNGLKCLGRIPLLKGEGAAKRRVRGTTKKMSFLWNPSPGLWPPSPFGRGTREMQIFNFVNCVPEQNSRPNFSRLLRREVRLRVFENLQNGGAIRLT